MNNTLIQHSVICTSVANFTVQSTKEHIVSIKYTISNKSETKLPILVKHLKQEIHKYLKDPLYQIICPTKIQGTTFQQKVCQQIALIMPGYTKSYGDIATILNSSPIAVGQACKRNPIVLIVPCHRVVGKNNIGGFAGTSYGKLIDIKLSLLADEHAL